VFLIVLLHLAKGAQRQAQQQAPSAHPSTARFSTLLVVERFQLTCGTALGCAIGQRERLHILRWLATSSPRRRSRCSDSLWCRALLLTILAGDVEVNPGPASTRRRNVPTATCLLCDKVGRSNAIKIPCASCNLFSHKTCLKKYQQLSEVDTNKLRRDKNYQCWGCSMPTLNDSFWSIPSIPSAPPSPPRQLNARGRPQKNAVKFLCFNARSIKNKKRAADICALLDSHSPDVCAINETWLSPEIKNHEFLPRDYVVLRKDRLGGKRAAGGVLLAIRPHLQPSRMEGLEGRAEIVWASIKVGGMKLLVGSAYRRPNSDASRCIMSFQTHFNSCAVSCEHQ